MKLNTNLTEQEEAVLKLIPRGSAVKRTAIEIGSIIGLDKRKVRYIINRLIKKGNPVVAKRNGADRGYYIATTKAELSDGLIALKKQQRETEVRIQLVQQIDLDQWAKEHKSESKKEVNK